MIDIDTLLTVKNYGKKLGLKRARAYQLITEGKAKTVKIDGVIFIVDNSDTQTK